jgi:hypothetical protein
MDEFDYRIVKKYPDETENPSGAKAHAYFAALAARLKSCPVTKQACCRVFPQPVKPTLILLP